MRERAFPSSVHRLPAIAALPRAARSSTSTLALAIPLFVGCGSPGHGADDGGPGGSGRPSDAAVDGENPADGSAGGSVMDGAAPPPSDASFAPDVQWLGDAQGAPRTFTVENHCSQTVWAAALPATTFPGGGIVEMAPGYAFEVGVDNGWSGRIWGKVQCATSGAKLTCASDAFPASLAELTLTKTATGLDFYDVSLVDGFNLPIALVAQGHAPDSAHPYDCGSPTCAADLNATCAQPFRDSAGGAVVACANDACKVLGDDDASSPDCTYPNTYTEFFKSACPQAYSYPSDDPTSTFTCKGFNDYAVVFCP